MSSSSQPSITDAEWEVMRVLWADAPLTSREIINRLLIILPWKEGTIKSLINRLIQKEKIRKVKTDSVLLYEPIVLEEPSNNLRADKMIETVCTRERATIISHLVQTNDLSRAQIDQLIAQLSSKRVNAAEEIECHCLAGQCKCHNHTCHPNQL